MRLNLNRRDAGEGIGMRGAKLIIGVALLAMAAFVEAPPAMAIEGTSLCKVHQEPCASENIISGVHAVNVGDAAPYEPCRRQMPGSLSEWQRLSTL